MAALTDVARLGALARSGLMDSVAEPSFDRLTRLATRFLGVPVALVSLVDAERQFFKSCAGLPSPWAESRETPLSHSFCQHVVATGEPLVVGDARLDPRLQDNLAIPDIGVVAYLGIPLVVDGHVIGSFCAIDGEPRDWSDGDVAAMRDLAESVIAEVLLRAESAEAGRQRLAAEAARRQVEVTLASIGDAVITADTAARVTSINPAAGLLCGWPEGEAVGRPVGEVFAIIEEATGEPIPRYVDRILANAEPAPWRNHTVLLARDGTRREIEECGAPIVVEGQVVGAVVTFRDIGPRNRQAKALRAALDRVEAVLSTGDVGTWDYDLATGVVAGDRNLTRIYGMEPAGPTVGPVELFWEALVPEDRGAVRDRIARAVESEDQYEAQYRVRQRGGAVRHVTARGQIRRDAAGRAVQLSGVVIDVTEQTRAQEQFRDAKARLDHLLSAGSVATWTWDIAADRVVADANLARLFQVSPAEAGGGKLAAYTRAIHPDDRGRVGAAIAAALETGSRYDEEYRVLAQDGGIRWLIARGTIDRDARGGAMTLNGVVIDTTERHRAEEARERSEEKYRTLFESMDQGFCVIQVLRDAAGRPVDYRFLELNPAFELQTGFKDAAGLRMRQIIPDHDEFWFETYGRVAETGEPIRFQHASESMQGEAFDLYAFRIGEPAEQKVAVLFTNITHRVRNQAERERLVGQLVDADRRKDEFLAMLAHELRNPLGAIAGAVHLANRCADPAQLPELHGTIRHQVRHLTHLIDDLLDVSRITQGKIELRRQTVDLGPALDRAVFLARAQVDQKRHRLTISVADPSARFVADPVRVEQMLGNLLTNAAKYSDPGRRIDLEAGVEGGEVVFRVRDQGYGISAEMLPRIFGLFEQVDATLDRSRGGLGIGLALVRSLAEMHGGSIEAASEGEGRGSVFTLRLPVGEPGAEALIPGAAGPPRRPTAAGRVLVVDDNEVTARLTARMLRPAGFEVDVAHDGVAGLELARRVGPAVVLLDIGLPGLNGYEVAKRLRADDRCRDSLIVAVSGYGEASARERSKAAGFDLHLTKPLDFDELMAALGRS